MNLLLRTLEQWSTQQDYFWFLAILAWAAVIAAEWRPREKREAATAWWLIALAASHIVGAVVELVLLAQDILMPYVRLDAAMGFAQVAGTAALGWGATADSVRRRAWRAALAGVLIALGVWRMFRPVEAGYLLALIHAVAVWRLVSRPQPALNASAALLLVLVPILATHGPWAFAIGQGRKLTDLTLFAVPAAVMSVAAGIALAMRGWQRRLTQLVPEGADEPSLQRDLRRALLVLAAWMLCGIAAAVWYGRVARRAFEENMLRRIESGVLSLDENLVADVLGPDLRIVSIRRQYYPDGRPVDVARVPTALRARIEMLRQQLERLCQMNPDFKFVRIETPRQGQMLVFTSETPRRLSDRHVIHHALTSEDLERIASRRSFLDGPVFSASWQPRFQAHAPLLHPQTRQLRGWLVAVVSATRWHVTFTQARLQTMALVAVGVGLWALAVAYRLRRITRDMAERKAAAADAADRMKSAFLAKVSHELRTPIQSVLGYGELLAGAPLSEQHRGWLAALRSHGDIMLRLVNDLIDLGALQSGAFRLEPAPVGLRALIDECGVALRPALAAKGLRFHVEIAAAVPAWVNTDGIRLKQILLNLLNNAVKFTPAGQVSLSVKPGAGKVVEFVVADTGPGIPTAMRPRLFQPFVRLDPAAGEGSGLGLALVQGLCGAMNGTIQLDESVAAGATFVARLPLEPCDAPRGALATMAAEKAAFGGLRVLVAEDNTLVRELLTAFLTENGAEVTVAADGPTAVKLAAERAPDVLLLDIALPGLDGIGVAQHVRQQSSRRVRIIGLSAHAGAADEARARAAGMDVFLAKPVRLAQLAEALTGRDDKTDTPTAFAHKVADEGLRSRLALQFAAETPIVLAEMRAAIARCDWARVRSRAHYLKNSADILGAAVLQDACQRLAAVEEIADVGLAQRMLEAIEAAIPAKFLVSAQAAAADKN